jgi:hypothetical protein
MDQRFLLKAVTAGVILALAGCGGGGGDSTTTSSGGGGTTTTTTRAYTLPTEISAVPASTSVTASLRRASLFGRFDRALADLPSSSDYSQAKTSKYVEEHALEQFDIIEEVMTALAQTHYNESANQTGVAYKAMVAWEDENNGVSIKRLEPWVVKSELVTGVHPDGTTAEFNKVQAWIEEEDTSPGAAAGAKRVIRAEFKIYSGATFDTDGTVLSYGEWDLNVAFGDNATKFFVATSRTNGGTPELKINMDEGDWFSRAVLYRNGTSGYGKVEYPDFKSCMSMPCVPTTETAAYAYNDDYLAVKVNGDPVEYKDRASEVEMTHRYGLFYAAADSANGIAAGDNLEKHKSFGFPVSYTDSNGFMQHAYYGAWQGRHQLWGPNGGSIPAGTTVTREDFGANTTPVTYTTSTPLSGTLTKRTLVTGSLTDILDIPVETWINKHWDLVYDAGAWKSCAGWIEWSWDNVNQKPVPPLTCKEFTAPGSTTPPNSIPFVAFDNFDMLVSDSSGRKNVNIGRWDQSANGGMGGQAEYVYLKSGTSGATSDGFYAADRNMSNGQMTVRTPLEKLNPTTGDNVGVNIGGSIYVQYTGDFSSGKTGWVQKVLESFDQQSWTPTFSATGDTPFSPERGRDYYINNKGANYVVKRITGVDEAAAYEVFVELQTAANPVNYSAMLPTGTSYLRAPWRQEVRYTLNTTAGANFLKLMYASDDPNTTDVDESATATVLSSGEWGLRAYKDVLGNNDNNDSTTFSDDVPLMADGTAVTVDEWGVPANPAQRPVEFNWEYSQDGGWGTQQFLVKSDSTYLLLDDPLQLQSIVVANGAGVNKTLSLQFDGWMHGLPDLYMDLQKNDWTMSTAISNKIINIPVGTEVIDSNGVHYYIKPLQVSIFLAEVSAAAAGKSFPDVTTADALNVGDGSGLLPTFTDHGMSSTIPTADVKYSEGNEV